MKQSIAHVEENSAREFGFGYRIQLFALVQLKKNIWHEASILNNLMKDYAILIKTGKDFT